RCLTSFFSLRLSHFRKLTSSRLLWSLKAITSSAHGFEIAWIFRGRFDFFPDAAYVDVDWARRYIGGVAPNRIEQMIAGKHAAQVTGEIIEEAKFGRGGGNGLSANRQYHGGRIDVHIADGERTGRQWALEAAEHCFNTRY